jgi:type I restriction enzyme R subunit
LISGEGGIDKLLNAGAIRLYHADNTFSGGLIVRASKRGANLGLNDDEVAFYDALATNGTAVKVMGDDKLKVIAVKLLSTVRKSVTIDWNLRESARAKIRVMVRRILREYGYPPDLQEEAVKTVLAQAELVCADWEG